MNELISNEVAAIRIFAGVDSLFLKLLVLPLELA